MTGDTQCCEVLLHADHLSLRCSVIIKQPFNVFARVDFYAVCCIFAYIVCHSADCAPGHWCTFGVDRQYPSATNLTALVNNTCYDGRTLGYGGLCPVGYYCPGGVASVNPVPCDNGSYADEQGLSQCKTCVEGRLISTK